MVAERPAWGIMFRAIDRRAWPDTFYHFVFERADCELVDERELIDFFPLLLSYALACELHCGDGEILAFLRYRERMLTKSASLSEPICCYSMLWRKDGVVLPQRYGVPSNRFVGRMRI